MSVKQQIDSERSKLSHLKQRQAQLNKLLQQLALAEKNKTSGSKKQLQKQKHAKLQPQLQQKLRPKQVAITVSGKTITDKDENVVINTSDDNGDIKLPTMIPPQLLQRNLLSTKQPQAADNSVETTHHLCRENLPVQ